jgi:dephospho-CoA kinase
VTSGLSGLHTGSRGEERLFRPAWSVTLLAYGRWLLLGVALLIASLVLRAQGMWTAAHVAGLVGATLAAAALLGGFLMRASVRYGISATHIWAKVGLLGLREARVPRESVQHVTCVRSAAARLLGTGDVAVWTAGGASPAIVMRWVEGVEGLMEELGGARERGSERAREGKNAGLTQTGLTQTGLTQTGSRQGSRSQFLVVGLVGSIGAGKSEAARALAELGCVVIDADKLAKDALLRSDVKAQLAGWWGSEVLAENGEIDRSKLAGVIFRDAAKRAQLEAVVHPIVHQDRAAAIDTARDAGKPGVVIDAPLLFEAGSERFCDRVLCIDAPRGQRLQRVIATRGWSEAELARREAAQLSIEEKRKRADATIENDGTREQLRERVKGQWEAWRG